MTVAGALLVLIALPYPVSAAPRPDCDRVVRRQEGRLLMAAAASLQPALQETARLYRRISPRQEVSYTFAASGLLARQIEQGAPVDLFIAAADPPMDRLQRQGLLEPGSRRSLLTNQLVLIAPRADATLSRFADLTRPSVRRIAIGEPLTVPAGDYARQTLRSLGLWERLRPKLVTLANVRAVLTAVELGNAEAALVYRTDALGSERVRVVAIAAPQLHRPIRYPLAVLRRRPNADAARCYADFLQSPPAQAVFRRYGFGRTTDSRR